MYCKPETAIYYQLFFMNLNCCCLQLKPKLFLIILTNPVIFIPVFRAPELVRDRREPRPGGCVHQEGASARHTGPPHHRHQPHQAQQLRPLDVQVSDEIFWLCLNIFCFCLNIFPLRLIVRTSDLLPLRGTVLEDSIPALKSEKIKTIPTREVLEFCFPELQLSR